MNSIKHFSLIALTTTMSFGAFAYGTKKTAEEMRREVKRQSDPIAEVTKWGISGAVGAYAVREGLTRLNAPTKEKLAEVERIRTEYQELDGALSRTRSELRFARSNADFFEKSPTSDGFFDFERGWVGRSDRRPDMALLELQERELLEATSERSKRLITLHDDVFRKSPVFPSKAGKILKLNLKAAGVVVVALATKQALDLLLDPSRSEVTPDNLPEGVSIVHPNDPSYAKLSEQALDLDLLAKDPNGIKKLTDLGLPQADAAAVIAKVKLQTPSTELIEEESSEESTHTNAITNLN